MKKVRHFGSVAQHETDFLTYHEVDIEEEDDVEEEIGGTGHNQTPPVDGFRQLSVVFQQWDNCMPYANSTQYSHRSKYVFIL